MVRLGSRYQTAFLEVLETALLALFIFFATRLVVQNFRVQGPSMQPNLSSNELVLVSKLSYLTSQPKRGDVIVFRKPGGDHEDLVKRVIGLPNETIEIREGRIFIDGRLLDERSYVTSPGSTVMQPSAVPSDAYFLMGDNRTVSEDSRRFGAVPIPAIVGKVWVIYWPPSEFGFMPRQAPVPQPAPKRAQTAPAASPVA